MKAPMKFKYLLFTILLLGVSSLAGCEATSSSNAQPKVDGSPTNQENNIAISNKVGLLYTNLVDQETQNEVKDILIKGGIQSAYVEDVFSWINQYNAGVEGLDTFKLAPSFTQTESQYVWYGSSDDYPDVNRYWWKVNKYDYTDVLCRSTAFYLLRDFLTITGRVPEAEWHVIDDENDYSKSWLVTDMLGIKTNPNLHLTQDEIAQYFTLYNPIPLPSGSSEQEMYTVIKEEWDRRGISFQEGSVSLITIWMQSIELTAASHAAVLVKYDEGLLLFEKTNPEYPYQATKFSTIEEVKAYMINQLNSTYEDGAGTVIVMQNNLLL